MLELISRYFGKNHHAYAFQAAGGTACASSHQHDNGKQSPKYGCPFHVVVCCKAGGCLEGNHLEQGFTEGFFHSHATGIIEYERYDGGKEYD